MHMLSKASAGVSEETSGKSIRREEGPSTRTQLVQPEDTAVLQHGLNTESRS